MLCGAINNWQLTDALLIFYGVLICIMIFLGEHIRSRVYERITSDFEPTSIGIEFRPDRLPSIVDANRDDGDVSSQPEVPSDAGFIIKRILDIVVSTLALLIFAPLIAVIVAAIKFDSPGPVVDRQVRVGLDGRRFIILRFRTADLGDGRVTRVGKFMRRARGLVELPELINVLRGDMSLVGPAPITPAQNEEYKTLIRYVARNDVKPGLTGLAQVSGLGGEASRPEQIVERAKFDRWYINNWSLGLDINILLRSIYSILRTRAY